MFNNNNATIADVIDNVTNLAKWYRPRRACVERVTELASGDARRYSWTPVYASRHGVAPRVCAHRAPISFPCEVGDTVASACYSDAIHDAVILKTFAALTDAASAGAIRPDSDAVSVWCFCPRIHVGRLELIAPSDNVWPEERRQKIDLYARARPAYPWAVHDVRAYETPWQIEIYAVQV